MENLMHHNTPTSKPAGDGGFSHGMAQDLLESNTSDFDEYGSTSPPPSPRDGRRSPPPQSPFTTHGTIQRSPPWPIVVRSPTPRRPSPSSPTAPLAGLHPALFRCPQPDGRLTLVRRHRHGHGRSDNSPCRRDDRNNCASLSLSFNRNADWRRSPQM
ncbi:hypothetical protein E2562_014004 [Oryza meyeriana var. granulata]|uniref:Uncharacterized protein n=1 Tax=Oryza meyeriana var. granulata TaxID=110450 RepID=A0A6G1DIX1_9ORYZ|nr:hypothetical protein E2562_014004 [Oryza meyeriana var. granulata]